MNREDMWWARFNTIDEKDEDEIKTAFNNFMDTLVNIGLSVLAGSLSMFTIYCILTEALSEDFITVEEGIFLLCMLLFFVLAFVGIFWVTKVLVKQQN